MLKSYMIVLNDKDNASNGNAYDAGTNDIYDYMGLQYLCVSVMFVVVLASGN